MIKFYFHIGPNPAKVLLFLEETGLAYELLPVSINEGDQHTPEFRKVNPNGKVPAIIDTDGPGGREVRVFDSSAILLYLGEKTGKLLGKPEDRGELLSWMFFIASGLGPYSGQSVHFHRGAPEKIQYAMTRYKHEAERHYNVLDDHLANNEYILGGDYSIADISAYGWMVLAARVLDIKENPLKHFPNVKRWLELMKTRPAVKRLREIENAHAKNFEFNEESRRILFPSNYLDIAEKWRKA